METNKNIINNKDANDEKRVPYVDLKELSKKNVKSNADIILSIIEIASSDDVEIKSSKKSIGFWKYVVTYSQYKDIFINYKPETLKKYYHFILSSDNVPGCVTVIKNNEGFLNNEQFKIMSIVKYLSYFVFRGELNDNFSIFYQKLSSKKRALFPLEDKNNGEDRFTLLRRKRIID